MTSLDLYKLLKMIQEEPHVGKTAAVVMDALVESGWSQAYAVDFVNMALMSGPPAVAPYGPYGAPWKSHVLYDTEFMRSPSGGSCYFFRNIASKAPGETNLTMPARLQSGDRFDLRRITITSTKPLPDTATVHLKINRYGIFDGPAADIVARGILGAPCRTRINDNDDINVRLDLNAPNAPFEGAIRVSLWGWLQPPLGL